MTEAWNQWQGQIINGEFHLQKYLGGDDQGAVFLTEVPGKEAQAAAIKLIPVDPAKAEAELARWKLAADLSHPHLIRILRVGRCRLGDAELVFVVKEYAEETLAEVLPVRPLTPEETRDMLKPTLDAVAYLHGRGVVYGHLKPANIMAIGDQLKLSSERLSRAGELSLGSGKSGIYDPPEMTGGTITPAADIWSLGMTVAEVLTQRLPSWNGTEQPLLPQDLPAPFSDIVRGCLHRDPQHRWRISDINARLFPAAASPSPASPAAASPQKVSPQKQVAESTQPQSAKRRRFVLPAIIAAVILLAIFAVLKMSRNQAETQQGVSAAKPEQEVGSSSNPSDHSASTSNLKPSPVKASASGRPQTSSAAPPAASRSSADADVVQQILPDVPQKARDTIRGTIRVGVRVHVDPSGNVTGAELDFGSIPYFVRLATQAAQKWKFTPVRGNDQRDYVVNFDFKSTDITASAKRVLSQ